MGAVIMFPGMRRGSCATPTPMADVSAAVIILPVIRIERAHDEPAGSETTKSPSGRKRRRGRASPAVPSPVRTGRSHLAQP